MSLNLENSEIINKQYKHANNCCIQYGYLGLQMIYMILTLIALNFLEFVLIRSGKFIISLVLLIICLALGGVRFWYIRLKRRLCLLKHIREESFLSVFLVGRIGLFLLCLIPSSILSLQLLVSLTQKDSVLLTVTLVAIIPLWLLCERYFKFLLNRYFKDEFSFYFGDKVSFYFVFLIIVSLVLFLEFCWGNYPDLRGVAFSDAFKEGQVRVDINEYYLNKIASFMNGLDFSFIWSAEYASSGLESTFVKIGVWILVILKQSISVFAIMYLMQGANILALYHSKYLNG